MGPLCIGGCTASLATKSIAWAPERPGNIIRPASQPDIDELASCTSSLANYRR
jgi:hypothetical protein